MLIILTAFLGLVMVTIISLVPVYVLILIVIILIAVTVWTKMINTSGGG